MRVSARARRLGQVEDLSILRSQMEQRYQLQPIEQNEKPSKACSVAIVETNVMNGREKQPPIRGTLDKEMQFQFEWTVNETQLTQPAKRMRSDRTDVRTALTLSDERGWQNA